MPSLQQKKWSALIISMFITMIITIIALYLLDKIVPYARDVKGIENGNKAYYSAETSVNEALLAMSGANPGFETGGTVGSTMSSWYAFQLTAMGKTIPQVGKWNSEYNADWNKIWPGEPIQLVFPSSIINWTNVTLQFRVPDLNKNGMTNDETLSGGILPIINWILSGSGESLLASGSQILASQIFKSEGVGSVVKFTDTAFKNGMTLSGSASTFASSYAWFNCTINKCSLKLSIINPLLLSSPSNTYAPYLEYQVDMGTNPKIPLQYATIETQGYSMGFRKDISRNIRQLTTSEAADFTVFQ